MWATLIRNIYLLLAICPANPIGLGATTPISGLNINFYTPEAPRINAMYSAMKSAGLDIKATSGYRSLEDQTKLRAQNCFGDINILPKEDCAVPTNKPGESMHERGIAIDFACGNIGGYAFKNTPCYNWLMVNADKYHFENLPSEPWHWSINGK